MDLPISRPQFGQGNLHQNGQCKPRAGKKSRDLSRRPDLEDSRLEMPPMTQCVGGLMCTRTFHEEQMSGEGSYRSFSSGMLPSLGARSNRRVKLRKYIISPYDPRYRLFCESDYCWIPQSCYIAMVPHRVGIG